MLKTGLKTSPTGSTARPAFTQSSQERFLVKMQGERKRIEVCLLNGSRIRGEIVAFDQFTIVVKGATTDKVYKHAVSTIQPVTADTREVRAPVAPERARAPVPVVFRKRRLVKDGGGSR